MTIQTTEFLTSDELRLLTNRGTSFLQVVTLEKMKIKFDIDQYGCPLVRYQDAKYQQRVVIDNLTLDLGLPFHLRTSL